MEKICFDSEKYIKLQKAEIQKRLKKFGGKLYMEFGGKLFDDFHASRVLPGFDPNIQVKLLDSFKDECEILMVISAEDIQNDKIRADFGITYEVEVLRLINVFRQRGLTVSGIVISLFNNQEGAIEFKQRLEEMGEKVYVHYFTKGYPTDVKTIVSEQGYGKNDYIKTTRPLVVVTAPGPGSGKLATCLSQLYHDNKHGIKAGYAKFEKFPVWNLPLKHPVNLAYEAATADLKDVNLIDSYHFEAYGEIAINYNRDLEAFPVLKRILHSILGKDIYKSPTDMGINTIASCITDDEMARESAKQEIISRYLKARARLKQGKASLQEIERIRLIMNDLGLSIYDRKCVMAAEAKKQDTKEPSFAIELEDGKVVVGRRTSLLSAPASAILNALKTLAGIEDKFELLPPVTLKPTINLKENILTTENKRLNVRDMLLVLSISASTNPLSNVALGKLLELRSCKAHSTNILSDSTMEVLGSLGLNVTCGDELLPSNLYNE